MLTVPASPGRPIRSSTRARPSAEAAARGRWRRARGRRPRPRPGTGRRPGIRRAPCGRPSADGSRRARARARPRRRAAAVAGADDARLGPVAALGEEPRQHPVADPRRLAGKTLRRQEDAQLGLVGQGAYEVALLVDPDEVDHRHPGRRPARGAAAAGRRRPWCSIRPSRARSRRRSLTAVFWPGSRASVGDDLAPAHAGTAALDEVQHLLAARQLRRGGAGASPGCALHEVEPALARGALRGPEAGLAFGRLLGLLGRRPAPCAAPARPGARPPARR